TGTPDKLLEGLIGRVKGLGLPKGAELSLLVKLDVAWSKLPATMVTKVVASAGSGANAGKSIVAINALRAFINEVRAQYGKKIAPADADWLIARAEQIIAQLSM
ncbi:MAG TPA: hypothetical protein VFR71_01965, partial [Methyloceanibacter sp.]|nr:hypothetical protein [Methyloceanibacter sp.]